MWRVCVKGITRDVNECFKKAENNKINIEFIERHTLVYIQCVMFIYKCNERNQE